METCQVFSVNKYGGKLAWAVPVSLLWYKKEILLNRVTIYHFGGLKKAEINNKT